MKLSITDRMVLIQVLASEQIKGNLLTLKLINDASARLYLTSSELKHINYTDSGNGRVTYDGIKASRKITNIPIHQLVHAVIIRHIESMNKSETLQPAMLATTERFIQLTPDEAKQFAEATATKLVTKGSFKHVTGSKKA